MLFMVTSPKLLCFLKFFATYENFPGHRFETQIHIQTQIRLNTILTLATKHKRLLTKIASTYTSRPFRSTQSRVAV